MKNKVVRFIAILAIVVAFVALAVGCGQQQKPAASASGSSAAAPAAVITCSKDDIVYAKVPFDFAEQIGAQKAETKLVPDAAAISLSVADANGATGVVLVPSIEEGNTTDVYLNAMVAGNNLHFAGPIASATSSVAGALPVGDGVDYVPAAINVKAPVDEVITFAMTDGTSYNVHVLPEFLPAFEVTGDGVAADNAGVYTFAIDKIMLRVGTDGTLLYFRDLNCVGHEKLCEAFAPHELADTMMFSYYVDLDPSLRAATNGYSSGMIILMDQNFAETEKLTLLPNSDENHQHGEGYLDFHEMRILGNPADRHYLLLSYIRQEVNNLPESLTGMDGKSKTLVWSGIMQEVKDGQVIAEINTADYPLLYESAVEKLDYAGATLDAIDVQVGQNVISSLADGTMDYTHVNSMDYTLDPDGTVDKLLVSMRDQSAIYQFDIDTAQIEWILGGKASTLTGYEDYAETRTDDNGAPFEALTFGQHFAMYTNKAADGTISGPIEFTVFDNHTGAQPFFRSLNPPTLTRVFRVTVDPEKETAKVTDVINGTDLDFTGKYHNASHCGSVQYINDDSVVIGWGLHGVIDNLGPAVPEGLMKEEGFDDLRQGSIPVVTECNKAGDKVTFELSVTRNPKLESAEGLYSYRTYKTAK